jgi:hypothetical protein
MQEIRLWPICYSRASIGASAFKGIKLSIARTPSRIGKDAPLCMALRRVKRLCTSARAGAPRVWEGMTTMTSACHLRKLTTGAGKAE